MEFVVSLVEKVLLLKKKKIFLYLFEREGEGERISNRLRAEHRAQHGAPSHDPEITT